MSARKRKKKAEPDETLEVVEQGQEPETNDLEETAGATEGEIVETRPDSVEDWREKYLRVLAELDNFRKRSEREREQSRQYASEGLARDLLPVLDALQMARGAEGDADSLREGVGLALDDALRVLKDRGVETIEADEGELFDPRFHEAVGMAIDPERKPNTIFKVERPGYRIKDRVLRPSRVHIVIPPPKQADAEEE
jgi:molecular chaperone GrpE